MAESIGLIERAAALLRQREAAEVGLPAARPPLAPAASARNRTRLADDAAAELMLDRGRLASFGIPLPSSDARARSRNSA